MFLASLKRWTVIRRNKEKNYQQPSCLIYKLKYTVLFQKTTTIKTDNKIQLIYFVFKIFLLGGMAG